MNDSGHPSLEIRTLRLIYQRSQPEGNSAPSKEHLGVYGCVLICDNDQEERAAFTGVLATGPGVLVVLQYTRCVSFIRNCRSKGLIVPPLSTCSLCSDLILSLCICLQDECMVVSSRFRHQVSFRGWKRTPPFTPIEKFHRITSIGANYPSCLLSFW